MWVRDSEFDLCKIGSVPDAADFLESWPHDKRTPLFIVAQIAMRAAANSSISVAEAREAFQSFCCEEGLLVEDPLKDRASP